MASVIHVTHEAVYQSGGIGTVLQGLITAPSYVGRIERTILLGPLSDSESDQPLGPEGEVIYDSGRGEWAEEAGPALASVENQYGVRLVYGRRRLGDSAVYAEVLLVDVGREPLGLDRFKYHLYEHFELDSQSYEGIWEYEQYLRLAEPGYEGVRRLLGPDQYPCFVIAHEFMGMPTVMRVLLEDDPRFATIFYAHEVATARLLVEQSPGYDLMFYNALKTARAAGMYMHEVFGPQDGYYKHALIKEAWRCNAVLAVGDWVVEELRFIGREFAGADIERVYNGVPTEQITLADKHEARRKLQVYAESLLHFRPDLVFTHVARLVPSKGLWRDLLVLQHLDGLLQRQGRTAVFIVLATEIGRRDSGSVEKMVEAYEWPLVHCEGYPDLSEGELEFDLLVRKFNGRARAVKILFVNQFGWNRANCGPAMSADMGFVDLRRGSDVEFGQSIYEPFGIAQVESLAFGTISVVSDVCGCIGYVEHSAGRGQVRGLIQGAYTHLEKPLDLAAVMQLGAASRRQVELGQGRQLATLLADCLPQTLQQAQSLLERGAEVASAMSWEKVVRDGFLPALERIARSGGKKWRNF